MYTVPVFWTFNLEVAEFHTYFVGEAQAWVHNSSCNLNNNDAISDFGIYEIHTPEGLHKVGKADQNRVTKSTGMPTRMHQQVRKLEKTHGEGAVSAKVVKPLGNTTTAAAKAAENSHLDDVVAKTGKVPPGNEKSYKPK